MSPRPVGPDETFWVFPIICLFGIVFVARYVPGTPP
jgi:hypothetical protein